MRSKKLCKILALSIYSEEFKAFLFELMMIPSMSESHKKIINTYLETNKDGSVKYDKEFKPIYKSSMIEQMFDKQWKAWSAKTKTMEL